MPIYSYHCPLCDVDTELVLPMSKRNDIHKHDCGMVMQRTMGVPHFKIPMSDYEAARAVMEDDRLPRNPAVTKAAMKRIHYDRSIF